MKSTTFALTLSLLLMNSTTIATETDKDPMIEAKIATYRATIKDFGGALKAKLVEALKSKGAIAALEVCYAEAPKIATEKSEASGITIGRTSLKPRNADNAPDHWEVAVLNVFEERKAQGEDPAKLEFYEVLENEGQKQLRYMKAIPTDASCLTCHGGEITPEIQAKLQELYPNDQAVGFKQGDIRGAFSLKQTLPE